MISARRVEALFFASLAAQVITSTTCMLALALPSPANTIAVVLAALVWGFGAGLGAAGFFLSPSTSERRSAS